MIWATWRQHRAEAACAVLAVGIVSIYLLVMGSQMQASSRGHVSQSVQIDYSFLRIGMLMKYVLIVLPAIVGMFVGAPLLAREIDQRTYLFAWSQSITRRRWFLYKVTLIGAGTLICAATLSVLATWWQSPLDGLFATGRWVFFDVIGVVPLAYAILAFSLGVTLGTVLGRTVGAIFMTGMLFAAVRIGFGLLRPWFIPPVVKEIAFYQTYPQGALQMNLHWVDSANHEVSPDHISQLLGQLLQQGVNDQGGQVPQATGASGLGLPKPPASESIRLAHQVDQYMRAHGLHYLAVFQPNDRFWTIQFIEAGVFFALALILLAVSAWWLQRRL
jgi:hypothetical protein